MKHADRRVVVDGLEYVVWREYAGTPFAPRYDWYARRADDPPTVRLWLPGAAPGQLEAAVRRAFALPGGE